MRFKLYHRSTLLGEITDVSREGVWMNGQFEPGPEAVAYRDFFSYMTDEAKGQQDPPFGEEYLNPDNWHLEEEDGQRREIEVPAVHNDQSIEWRWR